MPCQLRECTSANLTGRNVANSSRIKPRGLPSADGQIRKAADDPEKAYRPFVCKSEQGADSLVWLATSEEAAFIKGQYISSRKPALPNKQVQDMGLALALWVLSEKLCQAVK